mmetsp:Transcript_9893/g.26083  ORF Transcript_9893/g.26083 Transcript_9893/m.26083 type:complete len:280 (-) Transcript_9893:133-972(-)
MEARLDVQAFPAFGSFLAACQDYAELSGCRFLHGSFPGLAGDTCVSDALEGDRDTATRAAKFKAAPAVDEFAQRLRAKDEQLLECVESAHRCVMTESIRNGMIATCRELSMWPPRPGPPGISADDCAYEDTTAPFAAIAQRLYNDEARRDCEELLHQLQRRATTASFLVDFATEAGVAGPALSDSRQEMLQEFMARVEEWAASTSQGGTMTPVSVSALAREALLVGLGPGGAADSMRRQLRTRWRRNWETPAGAAVNVASVGLAVLAGYVALRRATRSR